jgi:hypothetical protein
MGSTAAPVFDFRFAEPYFVTVTRAKAMSRIPRFWLNATSSLTPTHFQQQRYRQTFPSFHLAPQTIMWIFPLIGYLGVILGFIFLTLAIGTAT